MASNVYRKGWAKADVSKVQKGNYDDVKELKFFQQARVEVIHYKYHFALEVL